MIRGDTSFKTMSRSGGSTNTSDCPANAKGCYVHVAAEPFEERIGGWGPNGPYTDPKDRMEPLTQREEMDELFNETQQNILREQAEQSTAPEAPSSAVPGLRNMDVPSRSFMQAPGSNYTPGIDDYMTYNPQPEKPGEYNEYEYVRPDNTEAQSPPSLRERAIYYRKQAAKEAGEPVAVATGEYLETWRDFFIPALLPFDGARYMGMKLPLPADYGSPLGPRQISAFDEIISNPIKNTLLFHQADGKTIPFSRPFNFLVSRNADYAHIDLRAPWLKQLDLRDRNLVKHFRQYDDRIYRLQKIEDLNGNTIRFFRNAAGWLERAEGSDGLALTFFNDAYGRRTRVTLIGTDGTRLEMARYSYGSRGHMTGADCAFGMSVRYDWDDKRDLLLCWHNLTRRSESFFAYDDDGRVLHTRTSGSWNNDRFRYAPAERRTTYLPSGDERLAQSFLYDQDYNVIKEIDAIGNAVSRTFNSSGYETSITDANGNTTAKVYDTSGNVRQCTDAEGRSTTFAWNAHSELDMVIDGAGGVRRFEYDEHGNRVAETDAEGHETRFVRDERGRLLSTVFPDGGTESRCYDKNGLLVSIIDARGGVSRFAYDGFGRVIETTDPLGGVTRIEYAAGAGGFATPTAIVDPDGVRVARSYAPDGTLATVSDGEGRVWTYTFGAFDHLEAVVDPSGGKLSFARDSEGRVTSVTNQNGLTYHVVRDAAGRTIAEEDFDGRRTVYRRDPGGRIIETIKPDGVRLLYSYDRTDNLTSVKSYAADASATPLDEMYFWYDRRGLLIKASNRAALVELKRDRNGQVVCETTNGRSVESVLDSRGHRVERRVGEGLVGIVRDPMGLVTEVAIDGKQPIFFERDALGRETRRASMAGFRLDQTWGAVRLLTQSAGRGRGFGGLAASTEVAAAATFAHRAYAWDRANAPVRIDDMIWGTSRYLYNANNQLEKTELGDGFTEIYEYDPAKNISGMASREPDDASRIGNLLTWHSTPGGVVKIARGAGGAITALTHDACGRVVERRVERKGFRPETWRYGWDAHNHLVRCDNPEGQIWFYCYDPFGRRLTKVREMTEKELAWTAQKHAALVPANARVATKIWTWPERPSGAAASDDSRAPVVGTLFSWDGDLPIEEAPLRLDGTVDWNAAERWHFEPETYRPLAKQAADGGLFPIVTDHLGTPREVFDESGRPVWAASYTSWGVLHNERHFPVPANENGRALFPRGHPRALHGAMGDAVSLCPIRFQGQWADDENGLHYNGQRYYIPDIGQYISIDPIGLAGGENICGYSSNPNVWVDPTGLRSANPSWSKARSDFWKDYAEQIRGINGPNRYSPDNIARMKLGLAPRMTILVRNRKTGEEKVVDVSVELHHRELPQRQGGAASNEPWNLTPSTPWGHESMDEFRSLGYDPVQILNGTNSWTNKGY